MEYLPSTMFPVDDPSIDIAAFAGGCNPSVCGEHMQREIAATVNRVTRKGIEDYENY
jgi:hypothetical protein